MKGALSFMCTAFLISLVTCTPVPQSDENHIPGVQKHEVQARHKRDFTYNELFNKLAYPEVTATSYVRTMTGTGPLANNMVFVGFGENNKNIINL